MYAMRGATSREQAQPRLPRWPRRAACLAWNAPSRCWPMPSTAMPASWWSAISIAMAPPPARPACAACACSARATSPMPCRTGWCTVTACRRGWWRSWPRCNRTCWSDHGIACHAGIAAAKARGWTVLVTDHHLPGETLPPADAIVDPNLPGDAFPSKALAGVA
jgi:hypothetical protein